MKLRKVMEILDAQLLTVGEGELDKEVFTACGSDMMSDVLAFVKNQAMLLTGLNNPQVVRTASMMDMLCVVFVRGKMPDESVIQMANQLEITILATSHTMFTACGLLYKGGLKGNDEKKR